MRTIREILVNLLKEDVSELNKHSLSGLLDKYEIKIREVKEEK